MCFPRFQFLPKPMPLDDYEWPLSTLVSKYLYFQSEYLNEDRSTVSLAKMQMNNSSF